MIKGRPPRLDQVFQSYDPPLYFVTLCTLHRQRIGDLRIAQCALEQYGAHAVEKFNIALGRYVVMPDHLHLFVRGDDNFVLGEWVKGLKRNHFYGFPGASETVSLATWFLRPPLAE